MNAKAMTADQVESFLRQAVETFGDADPFLIWPDSRTSFATVLDMLRRFKAAGVKHFEVSTLASTNASEVKHSLWGTDANIKSEPRPAAPPDPLR